MVVINSWIDTDTNRFMWEKPDTGQFVAIGSSGVIVPATASTDLTAGQVVYLSGDGLVSVADCTNLESFSNVIGITRRTVISGATNVPIQLSGLYPLAIAGSAAADLYLSTNGALTTDPAAVTGFLQRIALRWNDSAVLLFIGEPYLL